MKSTRLLLTLAISSVALFSCDSPEMVRKKDEQSVQITKLKGELAVLEEQLKAMPVDRSVDLAKLQQEAKAQKEEIEKLEQEVKDLEVKRDETQKEFENYKKKYVVR